MYAVIQTGGKQYRVAPGDSIEVEVLDGDVGAAIELDGVLAVSKDDGAVLAGADLSGAKVKATITGHGRGDKVRVFKFKRKKQYKRTIGHRQDFTRIRVDEIVA
ncbi:MAG: 50S ribosomal protein L21 [Bryobacteraceae bacterium]|nr:50S ribosomal protein L21 [Bryobacteraceae bacterium]